jgi:putative oxidoreductase
VLTRFLARQETTVYAALRIVAGALIALHGSQKFGVLSDHTPAVGSQVWIGGVIELIGGLCVVLGKWTVCAAFVLSGTMAVAYVQFHWKLQLGKMFLPTQNKGELALLFSLLFLYVACHGPGRWSLDAPSRRD